MFDFPFDIAGCQAVVMRVDPENARLERILKVCGFSRHVLPRLRGRGRAEAVYILGDDVWKAGKLYERIHRDG